MSTQPSDKLPYLTHELPNIYAASQKTPEMHIPQRLLAAVIGVVCLIVLTVAASLPPNPTGMGTHQKSLGLPSCNFLQRTGLPCPSCGMTTSWAWLMKGNLVASFYVQPMGAVLAILAAAAVWAGLYIAITGRPAHRLLRLLPARYTLYPLLLFAVLAWGWKILIHLNKIDGWHT